MAERLKDAEDRALEALFRSPPIADDGFSVSVVSRVRRQIWVRRLSLPIAIAVGGLVGLKPLVDVAGAVPQLVGLIPIDMLKIESLPVDGLPQMSTLLIGATIVMAITMAGRLLEE